MPQTFRLAGLVLLFALWLQPASFAGAERAEETERNLLWRVTSEQNTVFLLGSLHVLNDTGYRSNARLHRAFERSAKVAFEVHPERLGAPETQRLLLDKGLFHDDGTLRASLSPGTYRKAAAEVRALGAEIDQFQRYRPWFFALNLSVLKLQQLGFRPEHGVDRHFFRLARKQGKPVLGLETVSHQIGQLAKAGEENPDALVRQTLKDLQMAQTFMDRLVRAWKSGDAGALEALLHRSFAGFSELYRNLIIERNRHWLGRLETFLQQDRPVLVVVGAGHLVGPDGLVAMLRENGYRVVQQ